MACLRVFCGCIGRSGVHETVGDYSARREESFVDIYALGSRHKPLAELLSAYQRKYAIREVSHVLYALAYFDDADRERMPKMLWDLDWRTIKRAIQGWIREFVGSR